MQLIQEGEHTHYTTRKHWLNMPSNRLFHNTDDTTYSSGGTTSGGGKVRFDDNTTTSTNTTTSNAAFGLTMPTASDSSPVPRRHKSIAEYENTTTNTNNANNPTSTNSNTEDFPSGVRPKSMSFAQKNVSPLPRRDNNNNTATDEEGEKNLNNGRKLTVPLLSERLNALQHLTHPTPRPKNMNMYNAYSVYSGGNSSGAGGSGYSSAGNSGSGSISNMYGSTRGGEFLIDRFLRTLSTQDASPHGYSSTGAGIGGVGEGGVLLAADTLEAMAQLVTTSRYEVCFRCCYCCSVRCFFCSTCLVFCIAVT